MNKHFNTTFTLIIIILQSSPVAGLFQIKKNATPTTKLFGTNDWPFATFLGRCAPNFGECYHEMYVHAALHPWLPSPFLPTIFSLMGGERCAKGERVCDYRVVIKKVNENISWNTWQAQSITKRRDTFCCGEACRIIINVNTWTQNRKIPVLPSGSYELSWLQYLCSCHSWG